MSEPLKLNVSKKTTSELFVDIDNLEKQIEILILKYERIRLELMKRYQVLEDTEQFKPKRVGKK